MATVMAEEREIPLTVYRRLLEHYGPQGWWPGNGPFEVMVGAVLTQNTNWRNVERAIENLKAADLLDPARLAACTPQALAPHLRPAGYYNVKARRVLALVRWFVREADASLEKAFAGEPSEARKRLLRVRGVGPETADSILLYAAQRPVFVVDAYTRRIFERHALVDSGDGYDEVARYFTARLPVDTCLYNEYHALLVRLGKTCCRPQPQCETCPVRCVFMAAGRPYPRKGGSGLRQTPMPRR